MSSILKTLTFSLECLFLDDRRRGGRIRPTEDNRRHTLGNDMLVYSQQNQNLQQRAMDLEVSVIKISLNPLEEVFYFVFYFETFVSHHLGWSQNRNNSIHSRKE